MTIQELIVALAKCHPSTQIMFADEEGNQIHLLDVYDAYGGLVLKVGNASE